MKRDMARTLVEAGRRGGSKQKLHRPRRAAGPDAFPWHEGMRRPYKDQKEQGDKLGALERYLRKQVGRPWDKVWSDIQGALPKGVNGFHVRSHIDGWVARRPMLDKHGRLWDEHGAYTVDDHMTSAGGGQPMLYVDPRDGILKKAKPRKPAIRRKGAGSTGQFRPYASFYGKFVRPDFTVDQVQAILAHRDPQGLLKQGAPVDEYFSEAQAMRSRLRTAKDEAAVLAIVHQTFIRFFGKDTAGADMWYEGVAADLWALARPREQRPAWWVRRSSTGVLQTGDGKPVAS